MMAQRWCIVLSPDGAARTVSTHIAKTGVSEAGDRCKVFDTFTYRQTFTRLLTQTDDTLIVDLLNQSLIVSCLDFKATHLLVTALAPVTLFALNLLRSYGVVTVHWFFEDFRRAPYWTDVAEGYDHFCAIQRGPVEAYCRGKNIRYHFLPTACSVPEPFAIGNERPYDIVFIGIPSAYRIDCLEKLASEGRSLAIGGGGWKSYRGPLEKYIVGREWIDSQASWRLLNQSKIAINLSVDEPREREYTHISPRVYEAIAAGCLLVTEKTPLLADSFPGCPCTTFTTIDEACGQIATMLRHYGSSSGERENNRRMVLSGHTYRKRFEQLMNIAARQVPSGSPTPRDRRIHSSS
ncbi:MAG: glycosyltransferase family 1 protein [Chitinispirillaceae bacterium]|nr:glycosyltransferase family 1 protein [Chitinispirillaceae bacterium]